MPPKHQPYPQLLASAPTLERLELLIRRYFCGPRVLILHPDGGIETGNGVSPSHRWRQVNNRYRFEIA